LYLRKMIRISFLVFVVALPVLAQESTIEYGQPEELRGITKVFVNTGVDVQVRDMIVKVIHKRLPKLEVVSRPEDADIHLRFFTDKSAGTVVKLVGDKRERVLVRIRDMMPPLYHTDPIVNYAIQYARPLIVAREFVRTFRRVNS
jgi:hypothetical protein